MPVTSASVRVSCTLCPHGRSQSPSHPALSVPRQLPFAPAVTVTSKVRDVSHALEPRALSLRSGHTGLSLRQTGLCGAHTAPHSASACAPLAGPCGSCDGAGELGSHRLLQTSQKFPTVSGGRTVGKAVGAGPLGPPILSWVPSCLCQEGLAEASPGMRRARLCLHCPPGLALSSVGSPLRGR